ncbi:hypothetical protein BX600DRAFT_18417 [Xylariales sp. PMI_506]|nr:hypothetical protein BX600DRAFT_18417 [Xylariales sp. PMI_506]
MASSVSSAGDHLDAFSGREVVYCHNCYHEWYRDDHGLICPHCDGEATEIVSAENDPRQMDDPFPDSDPHAHLHDNDADPDEADIEEQLFGGPGGLFGHRTIHRTLENPSADDPPRANRGDAREIISQFGELLGNLGGGRQVVGRSGPDTLFGQEEGVPHQVSFTRFSGPGFSGGVSRVTISARGGTRTVISGGNRLNNGNDPFEAVFSNLIGQMGPPPMNRSSPNESQTPPADGMPANQGRPVGNPQADLNMIFQHLFSQILNPHAVHGDGVYTQEALDRIITNLMEANPQSNAPPPASAETIAKLPRKKLDEQILGPELKGECTICIDEMNLGDEAVVLPCKHWFHEECVVLWLKEHNTCPICRAAIEESSADQPSTAQPYEEASASTATSSSFRPEGAAERRRTNLRVRGTERLESIRNSARPSDWRDPSRRNSNSPPQPVPLPSRRARSPSPSDRRSTQSERSRDSGTSSGGPFSWLRDQFTRERRRS